MCCVVLCGWCNSTDLRTTGIGISKIVSTNIVGHSLVTLPLSSILNHDIHLCGITVVPVSTTQWILIWSSCTGCIGECWIACPVTEDHSGSVGYIQGSQASDVVSSGKSSLANWITNGAGQLYVATLAVCKHHVALAVNGGTHIRHCSSTNCGHKVSGCGTFQNGCSSVESCRTSLSSCDCELIKIGKAGWNCITGHVGGAQHISFPKHECAGSVSIRVNLSISGASRNVGTTASWIQCI